MRVVNRSVTIARAWSRPAETSLVRRSQGKPITHVEFDQAECGKL